MTNIVEITGVTVNYRENTALKNVTVSIREGSFVSVIGPNGAGKTTLLTVINGLGKIISGSVLIFGKSPAGSNIVSLRKDIGYVSQHNSIDPRFPISVKEAVSMGRFGKIGLLKKWSLHDEKAVQNASETVGIRHLLNKPIGHLSGGEHQKVAIARALAQEPKMILLDEPTSNLDPKSQYEIIRLIENIYTEKKITTVFVTHILSHIPECCSDGILMKKGNVTHTGNIKGVLNEDLLSELYDCRIQINVINGKRHFHTGEYHP